MNHVDDTGRLQTVTREENPMYYDLISAFHRKTGIPVILNTSFNENEPIVCTPEEAIDCFQRTRMDVLAIGPFLVVKSRGGEETVAALPGRRAGQFSSRAEALNPGPGELRHDARSVHQESRSGDHDSKHAQGHA